MHGEQGTSWLRRLPEIVAECEGRWNLAVGPPFPGLSYNYVAPAMRSDGSAAVLKLSLPQDPELRTEAEALRIFDGRGAVRILELDLERGAMLLERLVPGDALDSVRDDGEAISIAAGVMRELWRPAPLDHAFPLISDWARGFERLRQSFGGGTGPMPAPLVERAEAIFSELLASQEEPVLLHGDLHHGNVLSARRRPWLAIDPKGVVGERAFDTGALLYNPTELLDAPRPGDILRRRIDRLAEALSLDGARVGGWGLSRAVLAGYWGWEDSGEVWEEALTFARLLAEIEG